MNDTAKTAGTLQEFLYSIGNRIAIAKILMERNEDELITTILEDIARSVQDMIDEYCVLRS